MNYKERLDTIRSSSYLPYKPKEGYETLQQQWVSLLAAYHPIPPAERVPQIQYLTCNLRDSPSRNYTV